MSIVARAADALGYAHKQGVVHRDIKPANIMYDPETDTRQGHRLRHRAPHRFSSKTKTGMVLGTPSYMSPEQLAGKKIEGRSDLFSLARDASTSCSCGKLPFEGESMAQLMFKIANEAPTDIRTHQSRRARRRWSRSSTRRWRRTRTSVTRPARSSAAALRAARAAAASAARGRRQRRGHRALSDAMDLTQTLEIATCTDPGMVRSHNEDSIAADAGERPGGARRRHGRLQRRRSGERHGDHGDHHRDAQILASAKPYDVDQRTSEEIAARLVREQVLKANTSIYQAAQSQPQYAGMGTTLVVCLFYDNRMLVAHLGDSRLYLLRDGKFSQVTRDHSLLQEQIDSGHDHRRAGEEGAAQEPGDARRSASTRRSSPRSTSTRRKPGDIYLLCSDGLCDMVEDEDIGMTLQTLGGNLKLAAQQLVQMANDNGGRDNVSVILVRVLREYPGRARRHGQGFRRG